MNNDELLSQLEFAILDEVRYSVKIMKLLYPSNNYTLNDLVVKNKPYLKNNYNKRPKLNIDIINNNNNNNNNNNDISTQIIKNSNNNIDDDNNNDEDDSNYCRVVSVETLSREIKRRSSFSFAVMDMLKTDPVTKLIFLQEPVIEKRNARILKVRDV